MGKFFEESEEQVVNDLSGADSRGDLIFDSVFKDPRSGGKAVRFVYTHSPSECIMSEASLRTRLLNLTNNKLNTQEEHKAMAALAEMP